MWITAEKDPKVDEDEVVIEKEEILELSSGKVVRSSTFQALGEDNPSSSTSDDLRFVTVFRSKLSSRGLHPKITLIVNMINYRKKHRNSGDFYSTQWQSQRSDNLQGRSIISAIVPPYNYNPPGKVQPASPTLKSTDTFHKGSMKVTTV